MPAGIPSTYTKTDPRGPPDDTRGKQPSLTRSFALFVINLPTDASSGPFHPLQRQQIAVDKCDVWPPASFSYRRNVAGHHGVLKALTKPRLISMITGSVTVLSLPACSAGRAGTPGPLDPGNMQYIDVTEQRLPVGATSRLGWAWNALSISLEVLKNR